MPTQSQIRWSQLRVGLTVLFAATTLAILIFLMTGATGIFTKKISLRVHFDNAEGLRVGAPVRLEGVDVGNVTDIRISPTPPDPNRPVQVIMKVNTRYPIKKDAIATLSTAGVLGETFVDIDNRLAKDRIAQDGETLQSQAAPGIQDVIRSSQGTLQNVDILVKRVDRIVGQIESGEGSIGKLIYDEDLYKRLNSTLREVQDMVGAVSQGKGSIGKFINSDEIYNKVNASVDKLNKIIDDINSGQGTAGKFLKDPALYDNANATIQKANALMADINAGKGAMGKFAKDEEFARKLDNTITKLSEISNKIESGNGTVGLLLNDPKVYNNTDQMLVETRNLIKAIRENPKKYLTIHFRVF